MNMREYFEQYWPQHPVLAEETHDRTSPTYGDILAEMPADSPCGADCRAAVEAARFFDQHISMAYGRYNEESHPKSFEHRHSLLAGVVCVITCYIRG